MTNRKLGATLAAAAVALSLLLGTSTAHAARVIHDESNATGITNLDVAGTQYNVAFVFDSADDILRCSLRFRLPAL